MKLRLALLYLLSYAAAGQASCGSAFCTVNTNWDVQGLAPTGGWLVDLRYSYSKADRWMAGSSGKALPAPTGSDAEIEDGRTVNELLNLAIDYSIDRHWGFSLGVPLVRRSHVHTFDSSSGSGPITQEARFSTLGDVRMLGRYTFATGADSGAGLRFGLKLPTGATDKIMTPPDPADPTTPYRLERSSQPGTGSTDAIVGVNYFHNTPSRDLGWFISAQVQSALRTRDQYRPGRELTLDIGTHYEAAEGLNLLLQLNGQHRSRDTGINANPASGGYSWHFSPGLSYALTPQTQIYAFVQLPLTQYRNADPADPDSGQLAARRAASLGISQRF